MLSETMIESLILKMSFFPNLNFRIEIQMK